MNYPGAFTNLFIVRAVLQIGEEKELGIMAGQIIEELYNMWAENRPEFNFQAKDINGLGIWVTMPQGRDFWMFAHHLFFNSTFNSCEKLAKLAVDNNQTLPCNSY